MEQDESFRHLTTVLAHQYTKSKGFGPVVEMQQFSDGTDGLSISTDSPVPPAIPNGFT